MANIIEMPGENRPWLFPNIPGLTDETLIHTSRRSDQDSPLEYKFKIATLVQFLQDNYSFGGSVSAYTQKYPNHSASTLVWTENGGVLPTSNDQIIITENGKELDEGDEWTRSGATITLIFPISSANYKIRAFL